MLPSLGGTDNKGGKLEASGSFLSRMLGRSPSKGSVSPQPGAVAAAGGGLSPSNSKGSFTSTQPPGGSLKTALNQGAVSSSSNNWSIGSSKEGPKPPPGRVASAKNLEEAANRPSASPRVDKLLQATNTYSSPSVVPRVPSAQRLKPLVPAAGSSASPATSSTSSETTASSKLKDANDDIDPDTATMSHEELKQLAMSLRKETTALQNHIKAISGTGTPGSGAGMQQGAPAPAAAEPRKSGVSFAPHRNSVLVVEFAKPEHQQRPSMIANADQIRAGLAAAADEEMSFIEESTGKTKSGVSSKSSAVLETGPSLDPMQSQKAAEEAKRQLMLSQSIKKAEDDAKRAAEEKRKAEEAAAAAAAAAAGPAKTVTKRRYKLLSVYPLLPPSMRREEWSLSQFAVEKRLHKGYASEVYKARDIQSGELLAVKVYNLPQLGELNKVQLIREIRLHGSMAHRNIIELYVAFQEDSRVVLAQKYADGGDLLKALHHAGGRLTEHSAVSMVIQPLLSCLVYLHGKGIIHRDIKPENILFDEGVLKVADFGLALNTNEENAVTRAGTLHYMAPEVVKNPLKDHPDDFKNEVRYHYNVVVDSWAVGCLAYELLAGYPPFSANTQQQVVQNINNMQVAFAKRMSEDSIDFIKAALERNPGERATTTELIKHPWVQQHMRRGSSRHLTLQPQSAPLKTTTDFSSGIVKAKQDTARRAADHGLPKESIMAPF